MIPELWQMHHLTQRCHINLTARCTRKHHCLHFIGEQNEPLKHSIICPVTWLIDVAQRQHTQSDSGARPLYHVEDGGARAIEIELAELLGHTQRQLCYVPQGKAVVNEAYRSDVDRPTTQDRRQWPEVDLKSLHSSFLFQLNSDHSRGVFQGNHDQVKRASFIWYSLPSFIFLSLVTTYFTCYWVIFAHHRSKFRDNGETLGLCLSTTDSASSCRRLTQSEYSATCLLEDSINGISCVTFDTHVCFFFYTTAA